MNMLYNNPNSLKEKDIFTGIYDINSCYLNIKYGLGGKDALDWTEILLRMYKKWSYKKNYKIKIINLLNGDVTGIKDVTIKIIGKYAYGWLRTETGIHRLVRKSPYDSNKRRHTSFSSVFVYPKINNNIKININKKFLRIDYYKSSGSGGQNINKTESAVRITHIPTKISTQCQNERSQLQNKNKALQQLKAKLTEFYWKKKNQHKCKISWGNHIRSYILDKSRIKDLRTGIILYNINEVFNGKIDFLLKNSLIKGL